MEHHPRYSEERQTDQSDDRHSESSLLPDRTGSPGTVPSVVVSEFIHVFHATKSPTLANPQPRSLPVRRKATVRIASERLHTDLERPTLEPWVEPFRVAKEQGVAKARAPEFLTGSSTLSSG